jgi:hypothetical protein
MGHVIDFFSNGSPLRDLCPFGKVSLQRVGSSQKPLVMTLESALNRTVLRGMQRFARATDWPRLRVFFSYQKHTLQPNTQPASSSSLIRSRKDKPTTTPLNPRRLLPLSSRLQAQVKPDAAAAG